MKVRCDEDARAWYLPEKQMIFRLVPKLAVSTRLIPGRVVLVKDFTSTGGGVIAIGAILSSVG